MHWMTSIADTIDLQIATLTSVHIAHVVFHKAVHMCRHVGTELNMASMILKKIRPIGNHKLVDFKLNCKYFVTFLVSGER